MKTITLSILLVAAIAGTATSQPFRNFIGKATSQEYGYSVSQSADSSWVIGATYSTQFGGKRIPIISHTKKNGSVDLTKQVNITDLPSINSVWVEAVKSGSSRPNGSVMLINTFDDFYLVRLQNDGPVAWTRFFTNPAYFTNDGVKVKPIYNTNGGLTGFYIMGNHFNQAGSFVIKTDANGATVWQKKFDHPASTGNYYFRDIKTTADGGCIIAANQAGTSVQPTPLIIKMTAAGAVTWASAYRFNNDYNYTAEAITVTSDGYAVTGTYANNKNLTYKISSTGTITWANFYSTIDATVSYINGLAIDVDPLGNLIISGGGDNAANNRPAVMFKLSAGGSTQFGRKFAAESAIQGAVFYDVRVSNTTTYCAIGTSANVSATADIYLVNMTSGGVVSANCAPASFSVSAAATLTKVVTSAGPVVSNETLINLTSTANTVTVTTAQDRCGSSFDEPATETAKTFTTSVANDMAGRRIMLNLATQQTGSAAYEALLINSFGQQVGKTIINANQPAYISMQNMQTGIYTVAFKKNNEVVAQEKVIWTK